VKRIILATAAAAAAVAGLTACGHTGPPTRSPGAASASHGSVRVPVSCSQQYDAWKHGKGKAVIAALDAVGSAETAPDAHTLMAALKKTRPAVSQAAHHPVPACADPRGYLNVLLMHVNAAAAKGGSASSVRAAMQGVQKIEHQLTAELKNTAQ
jgi:hypothetical protein